MADEYELVFEDKQGVLAIKITDVWAESLTEAIAMAENILKNPSDWECVSVTRVKS